MDLRPARTAQPYRRVDPVQAYPLAVHLNGIAIDHRGDAGHVGLSWGGEQAENSNQGTHSPIVPWLGQKKSPTRARFASGWSDNCRVGLAPTNGRRLAAVHTPEVA